MSREIDYANEIICAIWLVKSRRTDKETIRLWSGFLNTSFGILDNLVKQALRMQADLDVDPCTNDVMKKSWIELESFTDIECKLLLNRGRKDAKR